MTVKPWRVAKSLDQLRKQINALAPNRNKASDGTIGDEAHQQTPSDHNPDVNRVVKALDITHDPANGVDCEVLANSLVASRDSRIKYIIWNKRISNPTVQNWLWRNRNKGDADHTHHIHISVVNDPEQYDDTDDWIFKLNNNPPPISNPVTWPDEQPNPTWGFWRRLVWYIFGV